MAKEIYLVTAPIYRPGMFSTFNTVIGALDYIEGQDAAGFKVDLSEDHRYRDDSKGSNWWEYFFEPIVVGSEENAQIRKFFTYEKIFFSLTTEFSMNRERAHALIQKYVRLKPHMQKKIDDFVDCHFNGHDVIGIHYRGTDKNEEAPAVPYDEVVNEINKVLPSLRKDCRIFIATDEQAFFDYMHKQFPEMVVALDALRSDNGKAVHCDITKDPYRRGEEAVLDCVLLSKTQILLKTASNLSDCSMMFNPHLAVIHLNRSYSE
jgi:hypothetical protein